MTKIQHWNGMPHYGLSKMPRYFVYMMQEGRIISGDDIGEEFDLLQAARGHALRVARDLARNSRSKALAGKSIVLIDE
jgi:Domain of unknown function (DUF6894)